LRKSTALRSKVFFPAHADADNNYWRELGHTVGPLWFDGETISIDRDEACEFRGHSSELGGRGFKRRWTRGAAGVPAGMRSLLVELADFGQYALRCAARKCSNWVQAVKTCLLAQIGCEE
jgi:hypothetical protein